jgi:hypothetical protein
MKEFALYAGIAMLLLAWLIVFIDILKHKFPKGVYGLCFA